MARSDIVHVAGTVKNDGFDLNVSGRIAHHIKSRCIRPTERSARHFLGSTNKTAQQYLTCIYDPRHLS